MKRLDQTQLPLVPSKPTVRLDYLSDILTDIGVWQHAEGRKPNVKFGYSIDDEARALIVAVRYFRLGVQPAFNRRMAETTFRFVQKSAISHGRDQGRFHNFCDANGHWLDDVGSFDSFGRTLWGLSIAYSANLPFLPQREVRNVLSRSIPLARYLGDLRSKAFVMLGLAESRLDDRVLHSLADELADSYEANSHPGWKWFENFMTYCNGRLPQALFAAFSIFPHEDRYAAIACESLDFLLNVTRQGKGGHWPVGNAPMEQGSWFTQGDAHPPCFDQQPVDAGALVESCVAAYHATGELRFRKAAYDAFAWYLGYNVHNLPVYDSATGAVYDAIIPEGVNTNCGAESVLSFHMAWQALQTIESID